jgi:hypothetical protein
MGNLNCRFCAWFMLLLTFCIASITMPTHVSVFARSSDRADGPSFSKAVIYYSGWDTLSRIRWGPKDVRRTAYVVITVSEPMRVKLIWESLHLPETSIMTEEADFAPAQDARLVLDFTTKDGKVLTYYASSTYLLTADSMHKRPIDSQFRDRFRFGE